MSSSKDHPDPPPTPVTPGKRRRQKNSSDEESYAGPVEAELVPTPVLPVSMASPSTVPLQRKRTRRTHGYLDEAIPTSMSQDDIRDEPLRVGGPNLSRLPVRNVHISAHHPIHQVWDDWLETAVHQILRQHEIEWRSVSLIRRPSRYDPRPESDMAITITVFADRKEANDRWLDACLVIRRLLRQSDHADLLVEIADPEIAKPTMTSPIGPNDRLVSIWPQIEPQIADILRPTECVQLQVLRRGKHLNPAANPVTVVMTIPEESRGDWTEVRERIIDVLDQHRLDDVAVEIGRGTIWRASSLEQRLLPDDAWETPAKGGLSLGLFRSSASSLTLGGFVEVQDKGGEWSRLGLTCYHGVFPMHSQDGVPCEKISKSSFSPLLFCVENPSRLTWPRALMEWHRTGVRPESPGADQIRVSQPSLKDHEQTVNEYRRQIETLRDERFLDIERRFEDNGFIMPFELKFLNVNKAAIKRLQDRINHADEFFRAAKDDLGPVWAGSGTRRSDQLATLDWALIKVKPDRLSINHVSLPLLSGGLMWLDGRRPLTTSRYRSQRNSLKRLVSCIIRSTRLSIARQTLLRVTLTCSRSEGAPGAPVACIMPSRPLNLGIGPTKITTGNRERSQATITPSQECSATTTSLGRAIPDPSC